MTKALGPVTVLVNAAGIFGPIATIENGDPEEWIATLNSAYGTSKVGLNQFTRHLAAELEGTGVTANVFHPGDVKTEMWSAITEEARVSGATEYLRWSKWVERTGGDPPSKAADLVVAQVLGGSEANGEFLWIDAPLQPPIDSWERPYEGQPWLAGDTAGDAGDA